MSSQVISSSSNIGLDAEGAVTKDAVDLHVRGTVSGVRALTEVGDRDDNGPAIFVGC